LLFSPWGVIYYNSCLSPILILPLTLLLRPLNARGTDNKLAHLHSLRVGARAHAAPTTSLLSARRARVLSEPLGPLRPLVFAPLLWSSLLIILNTRRPGFL